MDGVCGWYLPRMSQLLETGRVDGVKEWYLLGMNLSVYKETGKMDNMVRWYIPTQ